MSVDTGPVRVIHDSSSKLLGLLAICAFCLLGGGWLALNYLQSDLGFVLIGLSVVVAMVLWGIDLVVRLANADQPLLMIDSEGIRDRRISKSAVPWASVDSVIPINSRSGGVRGAQLVMRRAAVDAVPMPPHVRLMQAIDTMISTMVGLRVSAVGTDVTGQELYDLCLAYSRSHKEVQDVPANV